MTLSKEELIGKINKIGNMGIEDLRNYEAAIHRSTVDPKAKYFLLEAIDIRAEQLNNRQDLMAVDGDIDDMMD